ncbi:FtsX-like permease family protein [Glaciihabitans sp. dw_435]|uniref:FtsX-like permease family protein n=1 Tax=Glaciihabitans sp. dw_435 TaxID=2720081 RepID=UPI001BD58111|nr:FtsX-like permease family protein [Glaciihabitans sp. dw_435]
MTRRRTHLRPGDVVAEVYRSAVAQPVTTVMTALLLAALCATVLLTAGRTDASQRDVLAAVDSVGTRSIIFTMDAGAGVDPTVLDRLTALDQVEWAGAFGEAIDYRNSALGSAAGNVAFRTLWTTDPAGVGLDRPSAPTSAPIAFASSSGLSTLGMQHGRGVAVTGTGRTVGVGGGVNTPQYLRFLEPLIVVPAQASSPATDTVAVLVLVANSPAAVEPLTHTALTLLGESDPTKVKVQTSRTLADLRGILDSQLAGSGRVLIILLFASSAVLTSAVLLGLVVLKRKDFGRRRALGASRRLVVTLIVLQTAVTSVVGAVCGSIGAYAYLAITRSPLPDIGYCTALGTLSVLIALIASVLPAIIAARREPIRELRVP